MSFWRLWRPRQPKEFPERDFPVTGLPVIVFDVNETLLDLETLAPTFGPQPQVTGANLNEVADKLIARYETRYS